MEHEAWIVPLKLHHPFGISRGSATVLPTVLLRLGHGPHTGLGEATPVRYLGHNAPDLLAALTTACASLPEPVLTDSSTSNLGPRTPDLPEPVLTDSSTSASIGSPAPDLRSPNLLSSNLLSSNLLSPNLLSPNLLSPTILSPSHRSPNLLSPTLLSPTLLSPNLPAPVRAAIDIALWDRTARAAARPLRAELDLRHPPVLATTTTQTCFTIALDSLDAMARHAAEASHLPLLKLKLGRDPAFDQEALRRVAAAAPHARLRVDANGGWSFADALTLLPILRAHDVEFVEQPLARGQLAALAELRRHSPLPLYADEDIQGPESLPALRGRVDGINIKLMKCGGISPALAMIAAARREGWRVLLGCMIETRVGLAAAASLAGRVDELDLDAHMLTADDPVPPGSQRALSPELPALPGPGLGIPPRW